MWIISDIFACSVIREGSGKISAHALIVDCGKRSSPTLTKFLLLWVIEKGGLENKMKTIFAVQDPEFGWVGFQTAEEAGTEAIQINCYENLAEFNEAKLEKVRQDALAKLTDVEIEALGLEKFKLARPTRTHPDAPSTTTSESSGPLTASRKRGTLKLCLIILAVALAGLLVGIIMIRNGRGLNSQSIFQKSQTERKSTQLGQSGELKGAPAISPKLSDSAPKPAPLPEGFGHVKIPD
jgi:hypothetical protein